MARYFKVIGPGEWVENPQQRNAARVLAQFEVGSVESRAAGRVLLEHHAGDESLLIRHSDGGLFLHERALQPESAAAILRALAAAREERTKKISGED
jgi:hypothetical protein